MNSAVPQVAVITRTKNRALTLRRTMHSITEQIFKDFTWVIVNDGGDPEPVDEIAEEARALGATVTVIHQKQLGRWTAANVGVAQSQSEYLVLLDDDDTWDPSFLYATVEFLDQNADFGGVVTHTQIIDEIIEGNNIRTLDTYVFNQDLTSVYIIDMVRRNLMPLHSFLYRRAVLEAIGTYDQTLPVMADWEFHLRFIERYDIGVLSRVLANWHLRAKSHDDFGNTVRAGGDKHVLYDAVIRNRLLRRDLEAGRLGIGVLANLGRHHNQVMGVLNQLDGVLAKFTRAVHKSGLRTLLNRLAGKPTA